ncbi:MAG: nucleotidyltransferase family protein, partial [Lachnospiraceae bacterium]|nr:nucleotidyltransferase family protein [Lachnospiraceae bacterium]
MVIELPVVAATGSAEVFARGGMSLLLASGIVTDIVFGCEDEEPEMFKKVAGSLLKESDAFKERLNEGLKSGLSFAEARANAIIDNWDEPLEREALGKFIKSPNNILGIAYTQAILASKRQVEIHPLNRKGVSHDDSTHYGIYASASFLREALSNENSEAGDIMAFVPSMNMDIFEECMAEHKLVYASDFSVLLHEKLLSKKDFSNIMDCTEDISNRIINERENYLSFEQFSDVLHTKNMNLSRIRRLLIHILLSVTSVDLSVFKETGCAPYYHILGFTNTGSNLLATIRENSRRFVFTSPQEVPEDIDAGRLALLKKDLYAADLYRAIQTQKCGHTLPSEYTRKFTMHPDISSI